MKFLIINGKFARMSNGDFITVPDNYNNEPLTINGKLLMVGGAIVGKNFTGETQLATPQNVTADGTTVSWDEVENATSYAVLADGSEIGTVQGGPTGGTLTINFIDSANAGGEVIINNGAPQRIYGSQTKVYENVYYFEFRAYILYQISNQTGSMVGITSHYRQYEINGDGSATIVFED